MELIYKNMIQAFQDKKPWFIADGIRSPRYIDLYMGQTENPEQWEFVPNAILMNYAIKWDLQGKIYVGTPTIEFHCVPPDEFPSTSSISPRRDAGLKVIKWYNTVAQVLDIVTTDHSTRLRRSVESMAMSAVGPYHIMTYTCQMDAQPSTERDKLINGQIDNLNITGGIVRSYQL